MLGRVNTMGACCVGITLLCGCASMSSPTPESDFGNSYHQLVKGQIYDAEAAANPDPLGPQGISGERAVTDLKNLQRDNESGKTARTILKSAPLNYTIQK